MAIPTDISPRDIAASFRASGLDNADNEARWLCQFAAQRRLSAAEVSKLVARRCQGEPFQYVLGNTDFFGLEIAVGPGVLIPRPETEELVEHCLNELYPGHGDILDLCTGSGAIACALAANLPQSKVLGTDISPRALAWARQNQQQLHLNNLSLLQSDLFAAIPRERRFSLVTANPPYVSPAEYDELPEVIRLHEPDLALLADENGCQFHRLIAEQATDYLLPDGNLIMEIGCTQGQEVRQLLLDQHYRNVRILPDLAGRDRFAVGTRPSL
jgi:release factor glutamine methyltransferase